MQLGVQAAFGSADTSGKVGRNRAFEHSDSMRKLGGAT
jgi:hypothetical protein